MCVCRRIEKEKLYYTAALLSVDSVFGVQLDSQNENYPPSVGNRYQGSFDALLFNWNLNQGHQQL